MAVLETHNRAGSGEVAHNADRREAGTRINKTAVLYDVGGDKYVKIGNHGNDRGGTMVSV